MRGNGCLSQQLNALYLYCISVGCTALRLAGFLGLGDMAAVAGLLEEAVWWGSCMVSQRPHHCHMAESWGWSLSRPRQAHWGCRIQPLESLG
jgi:hypothetical protein